MASFNFSAIGKPKQNNNRSRDKSITTLKKDVFGVVHIDINGNYYVNINDVKVPILEKCYDTSKYKKLYAKTLVNGERLCIVKDDIHEHSTMNNYLPFGVGCVVKGTLLTSVIQNLIFDIKEVTLEHAEESVKAIKFWKKNYNKIQENIKKH